MSSPYEGQFSKTGLICYGQVESVDSAARTMRVKTAIAGEFDLPLTQIVHGMWHPDGDEVVAIPRVGTMGLVAFIEAEPFWLGAVPIAMNSGDTQRRNQESLNAGDWVAKTKAGNKIVARSGGAIEVQSTEICRTRWLPSKQLINSICQNWELETSGGHMKWLVDKKQETTNLQFKVWNSIQPENGITIDIGTIPEANNEESKENIKPFASEDLVFDFRQGTIGEKTEIDKRTLRMSIKKDGSFYFDIGPGKFTLSVDAETGDVQFETKGSVKAKVVKDVNLEVEGAVTATVKKDITLNAEQSVSANIKKDLNATVTGNLTASAEQVNVAAKSNATVKAGGAANVSADGDATVSAKGKATIAGQGGTDAGSGSSITNINGQSVALAGGGRPVAQLGSQAIGVGNEGRPVISIIQNGSPKVTSG